jgi:hypothetical protein
MREREEIPPQIEHSFRKGKKIKRKCDERIGKVVEEALLLYQ